MFFNDHNQPHFKVKYSEFEANILIENGTILNGDLPIKTTTSIINTPFFINAISEGVKKWKQKIKTPTTLYQVKS